MNLASDSFTLKLQLAHITVELVRADMSTVFMLKSVKSSFIVDCFDD